VRERDRYSAKGQENKRVKERERERERERGRNNRIEEK